MRTMALEISCKSVLGHFLNPSPRIWLISSGLFHLAEKSCSIEQFGQG